MNKATTNSYFPFFGVPYHLILHEKISGRGNYGLESFLFWGGEWGGGAGVTFSPRISSVLIKLHGKKKKKNEIVCLFNCIPITCRLEMESFSHNQK